MRRQPFVTSLGAKPSYTLGDPIEITFEIKNAGTDSYQLLTWGTPLEASLTGDCFAVQRNGSPISYDGKLVKRGDPPLDANGLIAPGALLTSTVDLSDAYPVDQPGDYTVTLNALSFDVFAVAGNAKSGTRKRAAHESHKLPAATVQFKVVAGGAAAKRTSGQAARKASPKQAKTSAKAPNFNGGTATQQADAIVAHGNAQYFAALAAAQLCRVNGP